MSSSISAAGRAATCAPSQPSGTRSWGSRARPGWWRSRVPRATARCCTRISSPSDLPPARFDGIFANASLFHVPSSQISRVLAELAAALKPRGALFCSNPRGDNQEGWVGGRYGCFYDLETWRALVTGAGFIELHHYYRPPGRPRDQQPWLATVWRKRDTGQPST